MEINPSFEIDRLRISISSDEALNLHDLISKRFVDVALGKIKIDMGEAYFIGQLSTNLYISAGEDLNLDVASNKAVYLAGLLLEADDPSGEARNKGLEIRTAIDMFALENAKPTDFNQ